MLRLFEPGREMAKTERNRFVFSLDAIIANWNGARVTIRLFFGLILDTPIFFVWISIYILWHYIEFANNEEIKKIKLETLIKELELLSKKINQKTFYEIRSTVPRSKVARAARFIYLNKTCFNGLWRVNSKGEFNVPFGKSKNPSLFVEENLRACSKRLKGSTITNESFEKAVSKARKGDLVYFDPPYIPLSASASFSAYAKEGFGINEQELLSETIGKLNAKGVYVLLSNSDTPMTRKIFRKSLTLRKVLMSRSISSSGSTRKPVYEVLGMNYSHLRGSAMGDLDLVSRPN
jgi:DNA adenine methylase